MMLTRRSYRLHAAVLVLLPAFAACNALLGGDDLSPQPSGSGGTNGDGDGDGDAIGDGDAGGASSGGNRATGDGDGDATGDGDGDGTASGGTLNGDGDGDSSGGGDSDSGDGDSGDGDSGDGDSGDGDSGDGDGNDGPDVRGRVIDFFKRPLPNIEVTIDGVGKATTDSTGAFSIADVPEEYSVEFVPNVSNRTYSWRFVGLTRRDPTLQVYYGKESQSPWVEFSASNLVPPGDGQVDVSFSSPVGNAIDDIGGGLSTSVDWRGPATIMARAHGLQWTPGNPSIFHGYTSFNITLAANVDVLLNSWTALATPGTVAGTVGATAGNLPDLMMFVSFPDGAHIPIVETGLDATESTYSELVPVLNDDESITVATVLNYGVTRAVGSYAGIQPDSGLVPKLELPTAAEITGPSTGETGVTAATTFSWTDASHSGCAIFVVEDSSFYQGTRIVTCDGSANISETTLQNVLTPGNSHAWYVESHGEYDSMDELTNDAGYLDAFWASHDLPQGTPKPGPGYLTESGRRSFYTAAP